MEQIDKFKFIPAVKSLSLIGAGFLYTASIKKIRVPSPSSVEYMSIALDLSEKMQIICGSKPDIVWSDVGDGANTIDIIVNRDIGGGDEYYTVKVLEGHIRLIGATPRGLLHAVTTFVQLILNCPREIPYLEIRDEPDFKTRGFYHDITRGRVPTLNTLKRLIDTLAFYKINQLQLYVEHAFAFDAIPEFSDGKTPITAEDIIELDKYCLEKHIDLVPSLSTFGHLYELLRLPRFEHLNELDIKASQTQRCLWERMAHYTLDVSNTESFDLVERMIMEYLPLFSSGYFNICCDETFDLGKGKNAARAEIEGVGRLYVDFVKKIIGVVKSMGKQPMLWGDIALKHPELLPELPNDVIFLNWDYAPNVSDASIKTFMKAGATQYVCSGVWGWSRFAADIDKACANITRTAQFGYEAYAAGMLNTDWGDCGQVNLLAHSYHGLAFGAEQSWNRDANADDFDERFSFLQWGIGGNRLGRILRELGGLNDYHFGNLYAWINDKRCLWYKEDDVMATNITEIEGKIIRAHEIKRELEELANEITDVSAIDVLRNVAKTDACLCAKSEFQEYIWAADATAWLLSALALKKKYEYDSNVPISVSPQKIIADGRIVAERFKILWRARNRESELCDVLDTIEKVLRRLDKMAT